MARVRDAQRACRAFVVALALTLTVAPGVAAVADAEFDAETPFSGAFFTQHPPTHNCGLHGAECVLCQFMSQALACHPGTAKSVPPASAPGARVNPAVGQVQNSLRAIERTRAPPSR